ncbi:secretion protein HylD [Bordetella genomosp. 8]|uniref:Secretion protein HylD n=1 Tax=Bordetella genomosp. 8 TaxID=1416806 RepID=A0A1W6YQ35_9BORD|nr:site-2 protease family protein [Bordetella genomosp. 8]ARP83128.1 secretion protein HylD [Bordetella genomosp. 8]
MKNLLPLLREELALMPGPVLADGQPSHTLHDPVRNRFFQIDWPTFEILSRWHLGEPSALAAAVSRETTLQAGHDDVADVVAFLRDNELLRPQPGAAADYARQLRRRRGGFGTWLLHNYLFFRIPLFKPDAWLARWAPRLSFFYSRAFLCLTLAALGWGWVEVYRQWDRFTATLVDTISWSGLASYAVTLAAVKTLHELGHAVTAKRLGCKVPAMGVAFLVMWPVAYTDTNDVWRLTRRRQRLAVVGAGVATELIVAAWATWAWAVLPEGTAKSLAFLLCTTTWIATIAINISPFMRFDGYFLLSDWLEMPNLHARAFALARWDLRERLFALGEPPPEYFPRHRRAGLILFAYATWIYRLVIFLGIAALVYAFFIKAVGILLFAVEIGWFLLLPLLRELQAWRRRWPAIRARRRARHSAMAALGLALLLCMPWPSRVAVSALLRPSDQLVLYAPTHARVQAMPVADGQRVEPGEVLLRLSSPDLDARRQSALARIESLRWQTSAASFDKQQRSQLQVSREQLGAAEAEVAAVDADAARYVPVAPFAGVLTDVNPEARPGVWMARQEPLARLVSNQGQMAIAYLDEDELNLIAVGDTGKFYSDTPEGPVARIEITGIDRDTSRTLPEPELSNLFGGSVVAREKNGQFYPERPIYRVSMKVLSTDATATQHAWRGTVVVFGKWAVPSWRYLRSAMAVLHREIGF